MTPVRPSLPTPPPLGRSSAVLSIGVVALVSLLMASYSGERRTPDTLHNPVLCEAARAWRVKYPQADDLQVLLSEVVFHPDAKNFALGSGSIITPIAASLPEAQEVLDVRGDPQPLRVLNADRVTALSWTYAGTLNREIDALGIALVRRPPLATTVHIPQNPSFAKLPPDLLVDATAMALDLEEHGLDHCVAFTAWAQTVAGPPPYTDQLKRIVSRVAAAASHLAPDAKETDGICNGLRTDRLTKHEAHVAAVMAARQVGIPAFGFLSTDSSARWLVGTYVDGLGWITLDLFGASPEYVTGGHALITATPIIGEFEGAVENFWYPTAAAYSKARWGTSPFARTRWLDHADAEDTTSLHAYPLHEVCP